MSSSPWRSLPKVELHRHLEGSIRFSTLLELARAQKIELPIKTSEQRAFFLVESPMENLAVVLNSFMHTQQVLSSEEILTRITFEAIEDAVHEGLRIVEFRYSPDFILDGHPHLDYKKIVRAIQRGVAMAKDLPIAVGLIAIFQRTRSLEHNLKFCDFVIENKGEFVGADLADDEVSQPGSYYHQVFTRLHHAGLPITIHAGEVPVPASVTNVKDAIESLHAIRIGHGIMSIKSESLIQQLVSQRIPLEVSVTSNWITQAVPQVQDHPIRRLMEKGVLVTINSDDPGLFGIDLVHEYDLLHRVFAFTESEFNHCNDVAAEKSFLPQELKQRHWPRPIRL